MTTYKVIPQVDFDKAVQKLLTLGLDRTPAENIILEFWKASQDLGLDFKVLVDKATASGHLDVEQSVLDKLNVNLPPTIRYYKNSLAKVASIAAREL